MRRWLPGLVAAGIALGASPATAAADTASFSYTGAAQTFTVPAGVSGVHVVAVGAKGGTGGATVGAGGAGGFGAVATADLAVSPGQVLQVYVGGTGSNAAGGGATSAGGFNGGGTGGSVPNGDSAGAGGGASDVRSGSDLPSRLVVAAGGGGGGFGGSGGKGGDPGSAGGNGSKTESFCLDATGGGGGTASAGGAAGAQATGGTRVASTVGSAGSGGDGGYDSNPVGAGGGGGGGLFGGGGGGASINTQGDYNCDGGGGGGGSSGFASSATNPSAATDSSGTPSVTFTYTPASGGGGDTPPPDGGGQQSPPPAAALDQVKPVISLLTLTPASFIAANTGPILAAAVGSRVVYELSEAATMTFTVERAAPGRRKGRTCVAPVKAKRGKKCTRYIRVQGSFTHSGAKGLNSFRFMGRIRGKALKRGNYRLVTTAADVAGNRSAVRRKAFRILR